MFFFQKGASMFGGCREQPTDAIYVLLEREGNFQLLKFLEVLTKSSFSEAVVTTLTPGYKFIYHF